MVLPSGDTLTAPFTSGVAITRFPEGTWGCALMGRRCTRGVHSHGWHDRRPPATREHARCVAARRGGTCGHRVVFDSNGTHRGPVSVVVCMCGGALNHTPPALVCAALRRLVAGALPSLATPTVLTMPGATEAIAGGCWTESCCTMSTRARRCADAVLLMCGRRFAAEGTLPVDVFPASSALTDAFVASNAGMRIAVHCEYSIAWY